jgi:hypothetical protein
MLAAVEELDNTLGDDILDLKKQVKELERGRSEDENRNRVMQAQMKSMEQNMIKMEQYISMTVGLHDIRIDTFVAQVSASVSGGLRQTGSSSQNPLANNLTIHDRIDALVQQLAEGVERSRNLQVQEAKMSCHCTHTMLNGAIKKLNKRMAQVGGTTRKHLIA